jgi:YHS domain-containing protein
MKKSIFILLVAFLSATLFGQTNQKNGIAILGYDPVAYFENAKAIEGKKEITAKFNDVTYQFSSESNKTLFLKNPAHYEPQFGGYCAYGMSKGYKAPVQPEAFSIVENKLYLNYNLEVKEIWSKEQAARIEKAALNWGKIKKS